MADGTLELAGTVSGELTNEQSVSGSLQKTGEVEGELSLATERIVSTDYNDLKNKPSIEGVTLQDDKTFKQLGLDTLSVQEIEKILYLD